MNFLYALVSVVLVLFVTVESVLADDDTPNEPAIVPNTTVNPVEDTISTPEPDSSRIIQQVRANEPEPVPSASTTAPDEDEYEIRDVESVPSVNLAHQLEPELKALVKSIEAKPGLRSSLLKTLETNQLDPQISTVIKSIAAILPEPEPIEPLEQTEPSETSTSAPISSLLKSVQQDVKVLKRQVKTIQTSLTKVRHAIAEVGQLLRTSLNVKLDTTF